MKKNLVALVSITFITLSIVWLTAKYSEVNNKCMSNKINNLYTKKMNDEVLASSSEYNIILRTDNHSGITYLTRNNGGCIEVIASDEDIIPQVEKLVPKEISLILASQFVKKEIEESGGTEQVQNTIMANTKKYGDDFYNYLTPLSIQSYRLNGVIIPTKDREVQNDLDKTSLTGTYYSEDGVGEITIRLENNLNLFVTGKTILPGPSNNLDKETVDVKVGKINGQLLMHGNYGTYTDIDPECTLNFIFKTKDELSIENSNKCDMTIQNFSGNYNKK